MRVQLALPLLVLMLGAACAPTTTGSPPPPCGDGTQASDEACDDGNTVAGDGCSASCTVEDGFTCTGTPAQCVTTCGDGQAAGAEECDSGDVDGLTGCTPDCTREPGVTSCSGSPSECQATCGDGVSALDEACDDGNTSNGDGCSVTCQLEGDHFCVGAPAQCYPMCAGASQQIYVDAPMTVFGLGDVATVSAVNVPSGGTVRWYRWHNHAFEEIGEGVTVDLTVEDSPTIIVARLVDPERGCGRSAPAIGSLAVRQPDYEVGQPLPPAFGTNSAGERVDFSSFHGRYLLLDFCAAWCTPCRNDVAPAVQPVTDALAEAGVDLVWVQALVQDDQQQPSDAADAEEWFRRYRVVPDGVVLHTAGVQASSMEVAFYRAGLFGFPGFIFVDPDGVIYAVREDVPTAQQIANLVANRAGVDAPTIGEILPIVDIVRTVHVSVRIDDKEGTGDLRLRPQGFLKAESFLEGNLPDDTSLWLWPTRDAGTGVESWRVDLGFLSEFPPPGTVISLTFTQPNWLDGRARVLAPGAADATVHTYYVDEQNSDIDGYLSEFASSAVGVDGETITFGSFTVGAGTAPAGSYLDMLEIRAPGLLAPAP